MSSLNNSLEFLKDFPDNSCWFCASKLEFFGSIESLDSVGIGR